MKIDILKLLNDVETYPTWYSNKTYRFIVTDNKDGTITVMYPCTGRQPKQTFNRYIELTPQLIWTLGFIEGEGLKSRGKSAYRRFIVTNNDSEKMAFVLDVLETYNFVKRSNLTKNSIRIRYGNEHNREKLLKYWSKKLNVKRNIIYISQTPDPIKKSEFGTCDIYLSNIILRRVIDEIKSYVFRSMKPI